MCQCEWRILIFISLLFFFVQKCYIAMLRFVNFATYFTVLPFDHLTLTWTIHLCLWFCRQSLLQPFFQCQAILSPCVSSLNSLRPRKSMSLHPYWGESICSSNHLFSCRPVGSKDERSVVHDLSYTFSFLWCHVCVFLFCNMIIYLWNVALAKVIWVNKKKNTTFVKQVLLWLTYRRVKPVKRLNG